MERKEEEEPRDRKRKRVVIPRKSGAIALCDVVGWIPITDDITHTVLAAKLHGEEPRMCVVSEVKKNGEGRMAYPPLAVDGLTHYCELPKGDAMHPRQIKLSRQMKVHYRSPLNGQWKRWAIPTSEFTDRIHELISIENPTTSDVEEFEELTRDWTKYENIHLGLQGQYIRLYEWEPRFRMRVEFTRHTQKKKKYKPVERDAKEEEKKESKEEKREEEEVSRTDEPGEIVKCVCELASNQYDDAWIHWDTACTCTALSCSFCEARPCITHPATSSSSSSSSSACKCEMTFGECIIHCCDCKGISCAFCIRSSTFALYFGCSRGEEEEILI
jgi:hypothetical protein